MPGTALTEAFMLGTATLMLGPVEDLLILDKTKSVGLMKNFVLKSTTSFTELTQGVKNTLVHSTKTGEDVEVNAELYEFTARNVSYAAGLDGSTLAAVASADKNIAGEVGSSTTVTVATLDLAKFTAGAEGVGDRIMIQLVDDPEQIAIRRVTTAATDTLTFETALPTSFATGADVLLSVCNNIALASQADQPFLSAYAVGQLANGEYASILMPKVRVTSGLNYGFKSDQYDHIPFSMKLYDLVTTDPFYAMFQKVGKEGRPAKAMLSTLQ